MKKKQFLTESDRKQIILNKEKAILESFAKTFNSIKRIDENEILPLNTESFKDWEGGWDGSSNSSSIKPERPELKTIYGTKAGDIVRSTEFSNRNYDYGSKYLVVKTTIKGEDTLVGLSCDYPDEKDNIVGVYGRLNIIFSNGRTSTYNEYLTLEDVDEEIRKTGNNHFVCDLIEDLLIKSQKDENELDEALTKQITTGTGWDAQTKTVKQGNLELNSYAKQLYQLFKKDGANPTLFSGNKGINVQQSENNVVIVVVDNDLMITIQKVGDPMAMANKYGPMIQREFPKLKLTQKPTEIGAEGWGAGPGVEFTFSLENGGAE